MNIKKQKSFIEELNKTMSESPEQAFEFFKESWPQYDYNERKVLATIIGLQVNKILELPELPLENKIVWLGIVHYTSKAVLDGKIIDLDNEVFPKITLAAGVNGNQITKIFHDLRVKGVITSTIDDIAEAIMTIFPIEFETARKDLSEEKRLQKVVSLLS